MFFTVEFPQFVVSSLSSLIFQTEKIAKTVKATLQCIKSFINLDKNLVKNIWTAIILGEYWSYNDIVMTYNA